MAFQQGLSGLNTSSKSIDVISNNIANASTVGFKSAEAHFADVFAASLTGAGANNVGIGSALGAVFQQFTQGTLTTTNNPLDIAINGQGFYRMSDGGAVTYSRNGQFHVDKNGFIVNDQDLRLTGFLADQSGIIVPSSPAELQIDASDLSPVATGASTGVAGFQGVRANINLDARVTLPGPWSAQVNTVPPAVAGGTVTIDPQGYNYSTALSIYDSLGNPHTLTFYFRKLATAGEWEVRANVDGTQEANVDIGAGFGTPVTFTFGTDGRPQTAPAGLFPENVLSASVNLAGVTADLIAGGQSVPNSNANPITFDLDFSDSTQFGSPFGTNRLEQDGFTSGRLAGVSVGQDGVVQGRYSNGQTRNLGQVVLANFTNPNGLQSLGGNQWAETSTSGPPLVGAPGSASLGVLNSSSVEDSNVDLTGELVKMITAQRNYQANAQSIKTQDQILQTLVNLR